MRVIFYSVIFIFILGCSGENCIYNKDSKDSWLTEFNAHASGFFITDSLNWIDKEEMNSPVIVYYICDTVERKSPIIQLQVETFPNSCAAMKEFEADLSYYLSEQPRYEKRCGPHFGLVQGNRYFYIDAYEHWDTLAYRTFETLTRSLLDSKPEKGSAFIRFTHKKAELQ